MPSAHARCTMAVIAAIAAMCHRGQLQWMAWQPDAVTPTNPACTHCNRCSRTPPLAALGEACQPDAVTAINFISQLIPMWRRTRKRAAAPTHCHARPQAALVEGVESLSQAKVGSALQVIFNLDQLKQVG